MQHPIGTRVKSKIKGPNFGVEGIVTRHWPYVRANPNGYDIYVTAFAPWTRYTMWEGAKTGLPGEGAWARSSEWERIIDPPLEVEETEQELERV